MLLQLQSLSLRCFSTAWMFLKSRVGYDSVMQGWGIPCFFPRVVRVIDFWSHFPPYFPLPLPPSISLSLSFSLSLSLSHSLSLSLSLSLSHSLSLSLALSQSQSLSLSLAAALLFICLHLAQGMHSRRRVCVRSWLCSMCAC